MIALVCSSMVAALHQVVRADIDATFNCGLWREVGTAIPPLHSISGALELRRVPLSA